MQNIFLINKGNTSIGKKNYPSRASLQMYASINYFKFILGDSFLSYDNNLPKWKNLLLHFYYNLKKIAVREEENFGLEISNVWVEKYPLLVTPVRNFPFKRRIG